MAGGNKMKVKIVIDTRKAEETGNHRSEIWSGELEILDKNEYLVMISVMGEGQPQPICQVPFAIGIGHYLWIPPDSEWQQVNDNVFDTEIE
jgi:hypothetical protein